MSGLLATLRPAGGTARRTRLIAVFGVIALLHIVGWTLNRAAVADGATSASFLGTGLLAYVLGIRHAFDADHIAAIDDTTRLMVQRGRKPTGVGFFFSMGHSSVVLLMTVAVALLAGTASQSDFTRLRELGGTVSTVVALVFLTLVAVLNSLALSGVVKCWRELRRGRLPLGEVEQHLHNRGAINRLLTGRARALIRSSWHMFPVGFLFGLGLETASEITLLTLSAATVQGGSVPWAATLSLPLLFAAGMSLCDTLDSLLMTRAYSWSAHNPARRLYYNMATTWATVFVAAFIAAVYLAGILSEDAGVPGLAGFASLADHFEFLGYVTVGCFAATWLGATLVWRLGGFEKAAPDALTAP
ncbi:HoxN/HupN/NixA family nickel/cobalt transporter [Streptomyces brasiliscabiei]|uniref:HoxN/HupN/NixA family nickel/cobalt transporter n=1 Tax=Streptomyces brasiliscabiei TaxID=2736302 RepID=UPI0030155FEA